MDIDVCRGRHFLTIIDSLKYRRRLLVGGVGKDYVA